MLRRGASWMILAGATAVLVALSGCGGIPDSRIPGHSLTIYSSLPMQGVSRSSAVAVTLPFVTSPVRRDHSFRRP